MKKPTEAERRAKLNKDRASEAKVDTVHRFLRRHEDGRLLATFPNHFGVISKGPIDLTHLDRHPGLRDAFAYGYVMHCLGVDGADTRYAKDQSIKGGFLRFLTDRKMEGLELSQLTEQTLKDFKGWLDDETSPGYLPSKNSRKAKIQDVQLVLKMLMVDATWGPRLSPELRLLENLYPGSHREIEPTQILSDAELEQLYVACAADCEATMRRVGGISAKLSALLARDTELKAVDIGNDPIRCAAFLIQNYGDRSPKRQTLRPVYEQWNAIDMVLLEQSRRVLYPDIDEILPFVLLLALLFSFNPGVVMNMTLNDYANDTFAGRERIKLFPDKPRKGGRHRNSVVKMEDPENPATLLAFLEARTDRVRRILRNEAFADRVFIWHSDEVRAGLPLEHSGWAWRHALKRFCERHSVAYFTLKQVRPTTLDLVHEVTGGDLVSTAQVAGHEVQTTHDHYTSAAMAARSDEMLGDGINQLWRFMLSGGAVDATERDRLNVDLGAATPGFACADPYDSPIKGERKGSLCAAYGMCPICPLALVDVASPHAYAYQRALLTRINEAQVSLGPAWLHRWASVKTRLVTRCLAAFPQRVILASGDVSIPPLPPVE